MKDMRDAEVIVVIIISIMSLIVVRQCSSPARACGHERVDIKDLSDGFKPIFPRFCTSDGTCTGTDVEPKTVTNLVAEPAPPWKQKAPRYDSERRLVQVQAKIIGYKLESDEDIHVIIGDLDIPSQGRHPWTTMVIEFPSAKCATDPRLAAARAAFLKLVPVKPSRRYGQLALPVGVTLVGIPFFDKHMPGHEPTGSAPNGIELHPVLAIQPL